MESARNFLYSSPIFSTRTQLKTSIFSSPSSSVSMFHEQVAPTAATSIPIASVSSHFPRSVLSQEQRDDCRAPPVLQFFKEDQAYQEATIEKLENGTLHVGKASSSFGGLGSEQQLLQWPDLRKLLSLLESGENPSSYLNTQSVAADSEEIMNVEPSNIVDLAKKALLASKQAAALAEDLELDLDDSLSESLGSANSSTLPVEEQEALTVRSTRHFERQSKRRRRQSKFTVSETYSSRKTNVRKKSSGSFNPNDPLRLFLRGPETTQLLTAKEESELIIQAQDLMRLMNVKSKLQSHFGREPTLVEWAEVLGLSCSALQAELRSGNKSREKLIYANFRLVVHVAKQYQGRGLNLQDLLQEGSMGLIKSVEKFKPQVGCRFATYAYWWIRQTISKSIIQHSRTIRLPENVYSLLGKVVDAKRSYIREGNRRPSKEELASRVGITVGKLDTLLFRARTPLSIQQPVWADQGTTLQEVTPDTGIEIPDVSVEKKLMRQHVRNLLRVLSPRERKIIRLRFGIEESRENSLSEVGNMFGLSKERVRQLESKALYKLKQCLVKQGLGAYADLLA
ncbi:RNApolymerase sigma-subunit F, SIGMA FACTOR 6 [Hibiscus trionum]|uniref:RNA polymerase sigma factor n=1 Tax=Hibiscus trionum TaxID=183268 RepID=A0A9W7MFW3_HIBTR|nr:RNApolymerase sigma-subunit F, SIGMA FACTOR 6 [Hibiscus trionum]